MSILTDALHDYNLRAFDNLDPPQLATPAVMGTPGSTEYQYKAAFVTLVGRTTPSDAVVVSTGPASLNSTDKIKLACQQVPAGVRTIQFYKKFGAYWKLLGTSTAAANELYDIGQALTEIYPADENTSGRPEWYALLVNPMRYAQRMEQSDQTAMFHRAVADLASMIHRDGDIIEGCAEALVSGTTWAFSAGKIYVDGLYIRVPAAQLELVGTGTERIGVVVTPRPITYEDDETLRNLDEGIPDTAYNQPGADRLTFDVEYVIDSDTAIPIMEFVDNAPKLKTERPEKTELQRTIAQGIYDVSGSFVTRNFPFRVDAHPTDATKLMLRVSGGVAYPNGFRVETKGVQSIPFDKARDVRFVNESASEAFSIPGGSVVTSNPENYDVDGLKLALQVGRGNEHEVALSGSGQTAAQVGAQIEAATNAYPTDGDLINCTAAGGYLQIQAIDGKSLTVAAIAGDAYTVLGISTGTYLPVGTRIYSINNPYVKDVSDLSYRVSIVEQRTHNGTTHIDALAHENVVTILGASASAADAHDGKWDYENGVDFVKDGNSISFAGMGGAEPSGGTTYYVCYEYNRLAVKGARSLVLVTDAPITKGSNYGTDNLSFDGATITRVATGESVSLSGAAPDVVSLLRVNNSQGQSVSQYTNQQFLKNSTGLAHATSQIDWSIAGAPGTGTVGQPTSGATYYATFLAWWHETEGDYVSADSYDVYESIETFLTLKLRDCLDFRTTGVWPVPDENANFDYNYYLSRVDKLVVSELGDFTLISGAPAKAAPVPNDQTTLLSLAVVRVNPYTYGPGDVSVVSLEPQRMTQAQLRKLRDRVERLEYWNVVNEHEKAVQNTNYQGDLNGIFADALTGFGRVDTAFNKLGIRHTAAIDQLTGTLLLPATREPKTLAVDLVNSTHVRRNGNILCLDYQPEVADQQLLASGWDNAAADWIYEAYIGIMKLSPFCNVFLDETQAPQVNVDYDNNLTGAAEDLSGEEFSAVIWGDWVITTDETAAFVDAASMQNGYWATVTETGTRTGVQVTQVPGSTMVDLGNQVVDLSVVPMLRTVDENGDPFVIHVDIIGLIPNQDHALSFGGKVVDLTYDDSVANPFGAQGTHTVEGRTTVRTDNSGRMTAKFVVPEGIPNGSIAVKVSHWSLPSQSSASGTFYGQGMMVTKQDTVIGIPTTTLQTETVTETAVLDTYDIMVDPLAQSFVTKDEITYYSGVGLFFKSKSATMPFTVQFRDMVNGYPGSKVFDSITLEPDEIDVSDDGSDETLFTCEHVVGYQPGIEYCFVPMPGTSTEYALWRAELGAIDILSGNVINPPMHDGVLFHSPNGRTWEPWTKKDLKFKLYKANFENDCQIVFHAINGIDAGRIAVAVQEFIAPGTNVIWSYKLDGTASWIPFKPGVDVILEQMITGVQLRIDVTALGGSYQIVEQIMGILFLLHVDSADYIMYQDVYTDPLALPNKITAAIPISADGTNGAGDTSVTPKYTVDDGLNWVDIQPKPGYTPVAAEEGFYIQEFETPDEATVSDASNTTPIVIASAGHLHQENEVAIIENVGGNTNANGLRRLRNVTANSFELYDPDSGAAIAGNGTYTSGGTINLAEFAALRPRVHLQTSNPARSPLVRRPGFVASRV